MDLKADVLMPVAKGLRDRADSLRAVKRFPRSGIEGWLKVEAVAALSDRVTKLQNKGPDLVLDGKLEIELKGATDLNPSWISEGALNPLIIREPVPNGGTLLTINIYLPILNLLLFWLSLTDMVNGSRRIQSCRSWHTGFSP